MSSSFLLRLSSPKLPVSLPQIIPPLLHLKPHKIPGPTPSYSPNPSQHRPRPILPRSILNFSSRLTLHLEMLAPSSFPLPPQTSLHSQTRTTGNYLFFMPWTMWRKYSNLLSGLHKVFLSFRRFLIGSWTGVTDHGVLRGEKKGVSGITIYYGSR